MALTLHKWIRLDLSTVPLPSGAGPLLHHHPIIRAAGGEAAPVQERNEIHYDTPDLQLYRNRVALTLNRRGEQWIQRLGLEEGSGQETKWVETAVPDQQLDLKTIRKTPLFPTLNGSDARNLAPVFTLHCREQTWSIHFPGGVSILLREERGYLKFGATRHPFHELVFEHQAGPLARWFQTALDLAYSLFLHEKTGPEKIDYREKSGPGLIGMTPVTRGFAWLDPTLLIPPVDQKIKASGTTDEAKPDEEWSPVQSDMTARQAFVHLCSGLLRRLQEYQCIVLYGGKQAKLAGVPLLFQTTGRLHALLSLYDPLFPREIGTELEEETGWLLKELTLVQACQMLLQETLEPLTEQFATHPGLEEMLLKTKNGLILAIKRLERALTSFRYARLVLGMESWLTGTLWEFLSDPVQREELEMPIGRLATNWLQESHAQVRKRGRKWSGMDLAALCALRDDIDRMAHATILFADLFANKRQETGARAKPSESRISFQESLNRVQHTTHLLVHVQTSSRFLTRGVNTKEGSANHPIQAWQEARIHRHLLDASREWELFSSKTSFWH